MKTKEAKVIDIQRIKLFDSKILDPDSFEQDIKQLFQKEYNDNIPDILLESEKDFILNITTNVYAHLQSIYYPGVKFDNRLEKLVQKVEDSIRKNYYENYSLINKSYKEFQIKLKLNSNQIPYLTHYKKHCKLTSLEAEHKCKGKFIQVFNKNDNTHVICSNCKKVYLSNNIMLYCDGCKIEYTSVSLFPDEDSNLMPATWDKYHCPSLDNPKMKCIKCSEIFYYDLKNDMLKCLNCNYEIDPNSILWKCITCKEQFQTGARFHNINEFKLLRDAVKKTFDRKVHARPFNVPCGCISDLKKTIFIHKKECHGELFLGLYAKYYIVVCSDCKTMNFYENYLWCCPICFKRFKQKLVENQYNDLFNVLTYTTNSNENLRKNTKYLNNSKEKRKINSMNITSDMQDGIFLSNIKKDYFLSSKENSPTRENYDNVEKKSILKSKFKKDLENSIKDGLNLKYHSNGKQISEFNLNERLNTDYSSNYQINHTLLFTNDRHIDNNLIKQNINDLKSDKKSLIEKNDNLLRLSVAKNLNDAYDYIEKEKVVNKDERRKSIKEEITNNSNNFERKDNKRNSVKENNQLAKNVEVEKKENNKPKSRNEDLLININTTDKTESTDKILKESKIDKTPEKNTSNDKLGYLLNSVNSSKKLPNFDIDDYEILNQIGEGSNGKIYMVKDTNNNKYALKKVIAHNIFEVYDFKKEFELLYTIDHTNVMKLYGINQSKLDPTTYGLYIIMELADSDWDSQIKKRSMKNNFYTEKQLIADLRQLVNCLTWLQKNNISHRDIKPQNILIFKDGYLKLADFGEAKKGRSIENQLNTLRGTELYMSPLLFNGLRENKEGISHNPFKSDVFSLGYCILYAATLKFDPLYEIREVYNMQTINQVIYRNLKKRYSDKFIQCILMMIEIDENKRFDFIDLQSYIDNNLI